MQSEVQIIRLFPILFFIILPFVSENLRNCEVAVWLKEPAY